MENELFPKLQTSGGVCTESRENRTNLRPISDFRYFVNYKPNTLQYPDLEFWYSTKIMIPDLVYNSRINLLLLLRSVISTFKLCSHRASALTLRRPTFVYTSTIHTERYHQC